jgi:hypothetical protein
MVERQGSPGMSRATSVPVCTGVHAPDLVPFDWIQPLALEGPDWASQLLGYRSAVGPRSMCVQNREKGWNLARRMEQRTIRRPLFTADHFETLWHIGSVLQFRSLWSCTSLGPDLASAVSEGSTGGLASQIRGKNKMGRMQWRWRGSQRGCGAQALFRMT